MCEKGIMVYKHLIRIIVLFRIFNQYVGQISVIPRNVKMFCEVNMTIYKDEPKNFLTGLCTHIILIDGFKFMVNNENLDVNNEFKYYYNVKVLLGLKITPSFAKNCDKSMAVLLYKQCKNKGYDGIHLEFNGNGNGNVTEKYTSMIKVMNELVDGVHKEGMILSVSDDACIFNPNYHYAYNTLSDFLIVRCDSNFDSCADEQEMKIKRSDDQNNYPLLLKSDPDFNHSKIIMTIDFLGNISTDGGNIKNSYRDICKIVNSDSVEIEDTENCKKRAILKNGNVITYNDVMTIVKKTQFAVKQNMAGVMATPIDADDINQNCPMVKYENIPGSPFHKLLVSVNEGLKKALMILDDDETKKDDNLALISTKDITSNVVYSSTDSYTGDNNLELGLSEEYDEINGIVRTKDQNELQSKNDYQNLEPDKYIPSQRGDIRMTSEETEDEDLFYEEMDSLHSENNNSFNFDSHMTIMCYMNIQVIPVISGDTFIPYACTHIIYGGIIYDHHSYEFSLNESTENALTQFISGIKLKTPRLKVLLGIKGKAAAQRYRVPDKLGSKWLYYLKKHDIDGLYFDHTDDPLYTNDDLEKVLDAIGDVFEKSGFILGVADKDCELYSKFQNSYSYKYKTDFVVIYCDSKFNTCKNNEDVFLEQLDSNFGNETDYSKLVLAVDFGGHLYESGIQKHSYKYYSSICHDKEEFRLQPEDTGNCKKNLIYHSGDNIQYNDVETIVKKMKFVHNHRLAGVMVLWVEGDDMAGLCHIEKYQNIPNQTTHPLLSAVVEGLVLANNTSIKVEETRTDQITPKLRNEENGTEKINDSRTTSASVTSKGTDSNILSENTISGWTSENVNISDSDVKFDYTNTTWLTYDDKTTDEMRSVTPLFFDPSTTTTKKRKLKPSRKAGKNNKSIRKEKQKVAVTYITEELINYTSTESGMIEIDHSNSGMMIEYSSNDSFLTIHLMAAIIAGILILLFLILIFCCVCKPNRR